MEDFSFWGFDGQPFVVRRNTRRTWIDFCVWQLGHVGLMESISLNLWVDSDMMKFKIIIIIACDINFEDWNKHGRLRAEEDSQKI